jgi:hypothetical protein
VTPHRSMLSLAIAICFIFREPTSAQCSTLQLVPINKRPRKMPRGPTVNYLLHLPALVKAETHFHADLHVYRFPILQRRFEAPLLHRFNCLGIKPESKPTNYSNISRMPVRIHDQPKDASSLRLCSACFAPRAFTSQSAGQ